MNKIGVNKLSKFNDIANAELQPDLIIKHLDQIFVLSKKAVNNLQNFFKQYPIEEEFNFEGSGNHDAICKKMVQDIQAHNFPQYPGKTVDQLPFHIHDTQWLADYCVEYLRKAEPKINFDVKQVQEFLQTSPAVAQKQNSFEQVVVKALIEVNMAKGLGRLVRRKSCQRNLVAYDEIFRNKILCCADALKIEQHNAELTLENNAGLWRQQNMQRAFTEFYYPASDRPEKEEDINHWHAFAKKHYHQWIKCREFEYYMKHFKAINETRTLTDNMTIGRIRYTVMAKELSEYNQERIQMVAACKRKQTSQNNLDL